MNPEYKQGDSLRSSQLGFRYRLGPVFVNRVAHKEYKFSKKNREQELMTTLPRAREIDSYTRHWRTRFDARIEALLPSPQPSQRVLAAMKYAVQGGHRWRPLLLISAYEEVSHKDGLEVIDAACAIELIHCCTIILDDLPFVDNNASLRRGKLPCHLVHGQAETVYASHLLYALAEQLSCENALKLGVEEKLVRQQITKLREDLVEAQVLEINLKNGMTPESEAVLQRLYELKGSLFVLAAWLAAIFGDFNAIQRARLTEFAKYLGISYQLMDDILDVQGVTAEMGKPGQMDEDKVNLVSQVGLERSAELLQKLVLKAEHTLDLMLGSKSLLHELLYRIIPFGTLTDKVAVSCDAHMRREGESR
jgi:geranylgeranyl pyrophosphate synthase